MYQIPAFLAYQRLRGFTPATIARRRWTLRAVCAETGRPLDEITTDQIEAFIARRVAAETRRAILNDLRAYFRWAIPRGHATNDPTLLLDPPRIPSRDPHPFTPAEIARLLNGADTRTRRCVALGAFAGLRAGEIGRITGEEITGGRVHVRAGKGGKDRTVPLHPRLAVEVQGVAGPLVGLEPHSVSNLLRARLNACDLAHHRPHDLRATFATEAVRVAPVPTVSRWLGHQAWATTQRYVMVDDSDTAAMAAMYSEAA